MGDRIFRKVKSASFNKTGFALGVLAEVDEGWRVPAYISEGLKWLSSEILRDDTISTTATARKIDAPNTATAV
jgi:hypothetical protein